MIVEDDPTFLNRFCRIVTADAELELFAAVRNGASPASRSPAARRTCSWSTSACPT
jgi:hypothetical protein